MSQKDFKTEVLTWLADNCPKSMRQPIHLDTDHCWGGRNFTFQNADQENWLRAMVEKGWTAPTWPTEYGGGGLNREQTKVLQQKLKASSWLGISGCDRRTFTNVTVGRKLKNL